VTGDLPVVARDEIPAGEDRRRGRVVGVLLAAGTSSRFGTENKLLAEIDGTPIVRRAARTLLRADTDSVVVVLGHEADRVRDALFDLDLSFVENPDYERGQSTSVAAGVDAAARSDADAAVFLPGDMPFVAPDTVNALRSAYDAGVGSALAAAFEGRRGNPVLFDARHFDALRRVDGDTGGRRVFLDADTAALVSVDDSGVRADVDTPADLRRRS